MRNGGAALKIHKLSIACGERGFHIREVSVFEVSVFEFSMLRRPLRRAAGLLFLLRLLLPAHSTTTTTSAPPVPTPRAADEDLPIAMPDRPPWDPSKLMKAEAAMHENLNSMLDGLPKFPFNTDALEANATSSLASSVDRDSSTPGEDEEGDDLDILDQSSVHSAVPPATATMTTSERPLLSPRQPARATPPAKTAATHPTTSITRKKKKLLVHLRGAPRSFGEVNFFAAKPAYYLGSNGGTCGNSASVIRSQAECADALEAVGKSRHIKYVFGTTAGWPNEIPGGCSFRGPQDGHYDERGHQGMVGRGRSDLAPVCRRAKEGWAGKAVGLAPQAATEIRP